MITRRGFIRGIFLVFSIATVIFMLASPALARPAQKPEDMATQALLPILLKKFTFGNGTVTGSVINASLHQDVPDAQVCWESNCVYSNESGEYTLENVASGNQVLTASKDGFVSANQKTYVVGSTVNYQNIAIIPDVYLSGVKYRIMTTWNATPCWPDPTDPTGQTCWDNDLDAHLWRWDIYQPISYHIGYYYHYNPVNDIYEYWTDYGDCRGFPNACLERDEKRGYGPETIAIKVRELAMYYFGVFNSNQGHPGVPPISQTNTLVRLYDSTGLVRSYQVPVDGGDNIFWLVFALNGETGDIIDKNCIIDYVDAYNIDTYPDCP
jgi:hypothetical protein